MSHWIYDRIPKVAVPEGSAGRWKVSRFTVREEEEARQKMRMAITGRRGVVPAGTYTSLSCDGFLIMSDTPDEAYDHLEFVREARGHVLINGLGIGMCLGAVLLKPEVTAVTVVEIEADVISLVAPSYQDERVRIVNADAMTYRPPVGERYGAVWHDIWPDKCVENLEEMKTLHRRYGRSADWQGSWSRSEVEMQAKRWA